MGSNTTRLSIVFLAILVSAGVSRLAAQSSIAVSGLSFGTAQTEQYRVSLESSDIRRRRLAGGWPFKTDSSTMILRLHVAALHFYHRNPINGLQAGATALLLPDDGTIWGMQFELRANINGGVYFTKGASKFGFMFSESGGLEIKNGFAVELFLSTPFLSIPNSEGLFLFQLGVRSDLPI